MENNNQKQQQRDNSGSVKKESTNSGGNDDDPPTSSSKPKDIIHGDVCSICMEDVSLLDIKTFVIYTCCGKVMHMDCNRQLANTKSLSFETRYSCPMCRAPNVPEGSKELIERLQKWSLRNRSWAQFTLGDLYNRGRGVNKDPKRACEFWKLAADQGHHHAQYNLGNMYAKGEGVIQSDTLAFKYFKLSAEQGHDHAQAKVGFYYFNGTGVDQSDTKAREWWNKAALQGQEEAIRNLKLLDNIEGRTTTINDNSTVLCSKCNKPAQTNRTLRNCKCKGAQYCNNTCYRAHWKEHKPEHNRLVELLPSTGETKEAPTEDKKKKTDENENEKNKSKKKQKPNDRCACGSKKKYKKCCGSRKR